MQTIAKVILGIGGVMLAIGILLSALGARGVGSVEGFSVEDDKVWSGSSGVYVHQDSSESGLLIFVSDEVRCDEFDLEEPGSWIHAPLRVWQKRNRALEEVSQNPYILATSPELAAQAYNTRIGHMTDLSALR